MNAPKVVAAGNAAYELYNVADHVTRCTQDAQRAIEHDDLAYARKALENCRRSAELFEMRWRDAVRALAEAAAEGVATHTCGAANGSRGCKACLRDGAR